MQHMSHFLFLVFLIVSGGAVWLQLPGALAFLLRDFSV